MNSADFINYLTLARPAGRLALIPDLDSWIKVHNFCQGTARQIDLSGLWDAPNALPNMVDILDALDGELAREPRPGFATNLDACFYLLDDSLYNGAVLGLLKWLESTHFSMLFLARDSVRLRKAMGRFSALHRLKEAKRVVQLDACGAPGIAELNAVFISPQVAPFHTQPASTLSDFITRSQLPKDVPEESYIIFNAGAWPVAGLNSAIPQHFDVTQKICDALGRSADTLSQAAQDWLCSYIIQSGKISPQELLKYFFDNASPTADILREWATLIAVEKEILLWLLPGNVPVNSYLAHVCSIPNVNPQNFAGFYVMPRCLDDYQSAWPVERRHALVEAGIEALETEIELFITNSIDEPDEKVMPWLNCGTLAERAELVRRYRINGYSDALAKAYPPLAAYLKSDITCYSENAGTYFAKYRTLVAQNDINAEFMTTQKELAHELISVPSRESILQSYFNDDGAALLVVDALGAEWLPILTTLGQERGLSIAASYVARASLPTLTSRNIIEWNSKRRLADIKELDNLAHNGLETHANRNDRENLAVMLQLPERIIHEVRKGLSRFPRVVVTGDHGMSRMAAVAYAQQKFAQALGDSPTSSGVRYCLRLENAKPDWNIEESLDGEYSCIANYDYFRKPQVTNYALHGGASPEEWLVPVVVFASSLHSVVNARPARSVQIIEDPDFDI